MVVIGLLGVLWRPFLAAGRYLRLLDLSRGTIDVTDARMLWEESQAIRHEMAAKIASLETRVAQLMQEIILLHQERTELLVRIAQLERGTS